MNIQGRIFRLTKCWSVTFMRHPLSSRETFRTRALIRDRVSAILDPPVSIADLKSREESE